MAADLLVRVTAQLAILGDGEALSDATVLMAGGKIQFIGPSANAPPPTPDEV